MPEYGLAVRFINFPMYFYLTCVFYDFIILSSVSCMGAKVDWDFWITDLVKNPDGTDVQPLWKISVKSGGPS